jgi:putative transposase
LVLVPPKVSISNFVGTIKGRTSIRVLNKFKQKPYWGNYFWARGYFVDTVGLDEEMIRKYVKYQETMKREKN